MLTVPFKKVTKFSGVYLLYLAIVWSFDYVYYPWLAIRFHSWLFLPLFPSIFLVSWGGFYLYEYFREDVFFIERINTWLKENSARGWRGRGKLGRWVLVGIAGSPSAADIWGLVGGAYRPGAAAF